MPVWPICKLAYGLQGGKHWSSSSTSTM